MCFRVSRRVSFRVVWGLVLGPGRRLVVGSGWPDGPGGGGVPLGLANTVQVFLGTFGGGEDEAAGHLVDLRFVWGFHPENPRFSPVDTDDGAQLHALGVRGVDFGADKGVIGTIPPLLGGGGLGGGDGLRGRGGGWGGGFFLWGGGMAPSDESWDSKCHVEPFLSRVLVAGALGGGGFTLVGGGGPLFHRFLTLPIGPGHPRPYTLVLRIRVPHLP